MSSSRAVPDTGSAAHPLCCLRRKQQKPDAMAQQRAALPPYAVSLSALPCPQMAVLQASDRNAAHCVLCCRQTGVFDPAGGHCAPFHGYLPALHAVCGQVHQTHQLPCLKRHAIRRFCVCSRQKKPHQRHRQPLVGRRARHCQQPAEVFSCGMACAHYRWHWRCHRGFYVLFYLLVYVLFFSPMVYAVLRLLHRLSDV